MRLAALALTAWLAGCSLTDPGSAECVNDSQCGDDVCASGGECTTRANVRAVLVTWTVDGTSADATNCTSHPDLFLQFSGADYLDRFRLPPVACVQGQFFVDKLPRRFQQVELGVEGGTAKVLPIEPKAAHVRFDLLP